MPLPNIQSPLPGETQKNWAWKVQTQGPQRMASGSDTISCSSQQSKSDSWAKGHQHRLVDLPGTPYPLSRTQHQPYNPQLCRSVFLRVEEAPNALAQRAYLADPVATWNSAFRTSVKSHPLHILPERQMENKIYKSSHQVSPDKLLKSKQNGARSPTVQRSPPTLPRPTPPLSRPPDLLLTYLGSHLSDQVIS